MCYLEAPVSILRNARTSELYSLVAGNELILECEVSRENATVQWLCNGRVLQADARTHIEKRGLVRKLVLSNLQVSDSGEYICDATDDKMNIVVTVQGKLNMTFYSNTINRKTPSERTLHKTMLISKYHSLFNRATIQVH